MNLRVRTKETKANMELISNELEIRMSKTYTYMAQVQQLVFAIDNETPLTIIVNTVTNAEHHSSLCRKKLQRVLGIASLTRPAQKIRQNQTADTIR